MTHDRTTSNGEALHEFFGADPDSYNIDLDETADGSGRPGIMRMPASRRPSPVIIAQRTLPSRKYWPVCGRLATSCP